MPPMARRLARLIGAILLGAYALLALVPALWSAPNRSADTGGMPGLLLIAGVCAAIVSFALARNAIQDGREPLGRLLLRYFGAGWIVGVFMTVGRSVIVSSFIDRSVGGGVASVIADLLGLAVVPLIFAIPGAGSAGVGSTPELIPISRPDSVKDPALAKPQIFTARGMGRP